MKKTVIATSLACVMMAAHAQQERSATTLPESPSQTLLAQAIPDAPKPQALPGIGAVAPGKGTTSTSAGEAATPADQPAPANTLPSGPAPSLSAGTGSADPAPEQPAAGAGVETIRGAGVTFVEVPFTVKDSKNKLVPGLTWRDVRLYENGVRQPLAVWIVDPLPLSVALVIDQSVPFSVMTSVNNSLPALQAAFTPYDEISVFTYNNGPKMVTDFTGAQSARLTQSIERSKGTGREVYMPGGGPLAQTTVINGQNFDPNTAAQRNHTGMELNPPKEVHALNDAILAAAVALSKTAVGRRRIIYVISDGKESGSTAKYKDVVRYLQTNKIAVYGTLVGDSSLPVVGYLDRIHLPLMMRDNILTSYMTATGGDLDPEFRQAGIERSFAHIAEEVRTQYETGFYTHESALDSKFRKIEVRILRPNLTVIAKDGYYPSATDVRPHTAAPQ